MKQNILITGQNYDLSIEVAKSLAEKLNFMVLNQIELFEFDHIPRSFGEVLKSEGKDYVDKKLRSIMKSELDYEKTIFVCPLASIRGSQEILYKVKYNNVVVLIENENSKKVNSNQSKDVQEFINISSEEVENLEEILKKHAVDFCISSKASPKKIADEIAEKINLAF